MMFLECNTWQHECKVTLLTSSSKEGNCKAARMRHMVDAMTSTKGKIQRASYGKR